MPRARRLDEEARTVDPFARWEHFPHEADVGVRGIGRTREEAFEQAALALTAVITDPVTVDAAETVTLACESDDDDLLLYDWLNALVYEMATRGLVFGRFRVEIDGHRLTASASGEPVRPEKHRPTVEVKGATVTELSVRRDADGRWRAQCVVDV